MQQTKARYESRYSVRCACKALEGFIGTSVIGRSTATGGYDIVTRSLHILDVGAGSAETSVVLWIYKKTDTVSNSSDTVTVSLSKHLELPLVGGSSVESAK